MTNEKFLCARRRISLSKNTRKPYDTSSKGGKRRPPQSVRTSYSLLSVFGYASPQVTPAFDDSPPLFASGLFRIRTRGKAMCQQCPHGVQRRSGWSGRDQAYETRADVACSCARPDSDSDMSAAMSDDDSDMRALSRGRRLDSLTYLWRGHPARG